MNREALDRWCEWGIWGLVLAVLAFGPLATGAVREIDFLVIQALTAGVGALWLVRIWLRPERRIFWPPLAWAVLAFAAYAVARYFTADIEYVARQEVMRVLVYAVLFCAIVDNLHFQNATQSMVFLLVVLAVGISFYALFQFTTGYAWVWNFPSLYKPRGSGTYICPNHTAGFLEMVLPLALAFTLVGRVKPVTRVLCGYAVLVILGGIAATVSRGGFIATGVALALMLGVLLFCRGHRLAALATLVVLAGGVAVVWSMNLSIQFRVRELLAGNRAQENTRFALWRPAILMFRDHVWWGAGPAHFNYHFREYRPVSVQLTPDRVHNDYLNTLADWGLAGAVLVAAALGLAAWGVARTWPHVRTGEADLGKRKGSNKFAIVLGAATGMVAILVHSFVDFNMHVPANAITAVTLLALLSAHLRFATEAHWLRSRPWTRALATALLLPLLLAFAAQGRRSFAEQMWLDRAEGAPNFSPERAACYERALAVEPRNFETAYAAGECYRVQSLEGNDDSAELAAKAMRWYALSITNNPLDAYGYLRYGMCLDWTGRAAESGPWFDRAEQLDPNGYFTVANIGLHYVALRNYAAARPWFERSLRLKWEDNPIAKNYLDISRRKLQEEVQGGLLPPPTVPGS